MEPITFPQCNIEIGKGQPEYVPLPAYLNKADETGPVTFCMQLNEQEKKQVAETGQIWITQLTFGGNFQPIRLSAIDPF